MVGAQREKRHGRVGYGETRYDPEELDEVCCNIAAEKHMDTGYDHGIADSATARPDTTPRSSMRSSAKSRLKNTWTLADEIGVERHQHAAEACELDEGNKVFCGNLAGFQGLSLEEVDARPMHCRFGYGETRHDPEELEMVFCNTAADKHMNTGYDHGASSQLAASADGTASDAIAGPPCGRRWTKRCWNDTRAGQPREMLPPAAPKVPPRDEMK